MSAYTNIFLIVAGASIGGLINRLRGWGKNGWGGTGGPAWLVFLQTYLFIRPVLAIAMGALMGGFSYHLDMHGPVAASIITAAACGWFFGIVWPWGDYLDGAVIPNVDHGIKWVDSFVEKILRPWLRTTRWPALADDADFIDSFSFGMRDIYYIPYCLSIMVVAGWFVLIPLSFFWQDAIVYHVARKYIKGDFVSAAEPFGGAIRTALMLIAIYFGSLWPAGF